MDQDVNRQNNFNIIRFVSAILVIYGHMFPLVNAEGLPFFMGQNIAVNGVCIFFILSGYLVGQSYEKDPNVLRYAIKRCFRIMPGLIVLILITVFIIGPLVTTGSIAEYFASPLIGEYLKNMALRVSFTLPNVFTSNPYPGYVNGSLWSLSVEMVMYAILPLLIFALKKVRKKYIILTGLALFLIGLRMIIKSSPVLSNMEIYAIGFGSAINVMPYFIIGYLFTVPKIKKFLNLQIAMVLFAFFAVVLVPSRITELLAYIVLPYIVFSFALTVKPVFMNFGIKNDFSYGLFLYGFLSQQIVIYIIAVRMRAVVPFYVYLLLSFGMAMAFSVFSWKLVENPMQKLSRRICKKLKTMAMEKESTTSLNYGTDVIH